jgi:hypothetical protein
MARRSTRFAIVLASVLTALASQASAQGRAASQPAEPLAFGTGGSYEYVFTDDPLAALPNGVIVPIIRMRPPVGSPRLHRPRTQFVAEMLKSVEAI